MNENSKLKNHPKQRWRDLPFLTKKSDLEYHPPSPLKKTTASDLSGNLPWMLLYISIGIGVYFAAPFELAGTTIALALLVSTALWAVISKPQHLRILASVALLLLIGFAVAHHRTHSVKTPLLPKKERAYSLGMKIEQAVPVRNNRIRYKGEVIFLSGLAAAATPKRIQLTTADQGPRYVYGDIMCARAILSRPGGPLRPGGYDYGWTLWFERIGGTGYTISSPALCQPLRGAEKTEENGLNSFIARLRTSIAARLSEGLAPREEALARTIILGERGRIEKQDLTALREAGLGHLLAISGLHMAVFAGTLFFIIRAGLALMPAWAENYPIKKWAAIAALAGGFAYFLISGQSIPTQRAFFMISIVFAAILLERPALTIRNVVLAALVILLFRPESLFHPGFQMSFAAVTALVLSYETKLKYDRKTEPLKSKAVLGWFRPLYFLGGICLTSLIATLATAPFAIYHFQAVSYMGPIGNMLAIPVFTFLVMPFAVLSLLLMPLGLEGLALGGLALAIDILLSTAHWTAANKPAIIHTGVITANALAFFAIAAMLAIFLSPKLKALALLPLLASLWLARPPHLPDLYVSAKGDVVALRGREGHLQAPTGRKGRFILNKWLQADGDPREVAEIRAIEIPANGEAGADYQTLHCDENACTGERKGKRITLVKTANALKEACNHADIVIYRRRVTRPCSHPQLLLSGQQLKRGGAHAIYFRDDKIQIKTAEEKRRHRIWGEGD